MTVMDLLQVGKALSNETRLQLLQIIADEPDSATGAHQRYVNKYSNQKHRESIYRALETLVDAELLTKEYEKDEGLVYQLPHREFIVDVQEANISPASAEGKRDN